MAANRVNGGETGARSGAQTLSLLAGTSNAFLLRALADGAKQQAELRRAAGSPAQTTLRAQLKRLADVGAVEKHRRNRFPGTLEYELTASGEKLLSVLDALERWLERAPDGALPIGSNAAKAATTALTEGWSTTMLRVLAAGPQSLTELDGIIASLSYPSLERRLAAMRLAGLVDANPGNGRRTPYLVTTWLRAGVAPLLSAARWERRSLSRDTAPIGRLEAETAFLLAMPLVRAPAGTLGSCRLGVEISNGSKRRLVGVIVNLSGDVGAQSCTTNLAGHSDAWALGSATAWLSAMVEGDADGLELGGDSPLARVLISGLHEALFGTPAQSNLEAGTSIGDDGST